MVIAHYNGRHAVSGRGLTGLAGWVDRLVMSGLLVATLLVSGCSWMDGGPVEVAPPPSQVTIKKKGTTPYTVFGVNYYPLKSAEGYKEQGIASWYGPSFHGKATASGEIYDMYGISAAHTVLPLPTVVRVTNLENGRQLLLPVNDRGPFVKNRIIDLSYGAAKDLGVLGKGTATVIVEAVPSSEEVAYLSKLPGWQGLVNGSRDARGKSGKVLAKAVAPSASPAQGVVAAPRVESAELPAAPGVGSAVPVTMGAGVAVAQVDSTVARATSATPALPGEAESQGHPQRFFVQAGAFQQVENARKLALKLAAVGKAEVQAVKRAAQELHRVVIGPVDSLEQAESMVNAMARMGIGAGRIIYE